MQTDMREPENHMEYMEGMEQIDSDILHQVIEARNQYQADAYTARDVEEALSHDNRSIEDFAALLSPAAAPFLEEMANMAKKETEKNFGKSGYLFTPN